MNRFPVIRPLIVVAAMMATHAVFAQNDAVAGEAAKVNGTTIPAYRIDAAIKSRLAQGQPDSPEMRKGIRDALINQEVIAQEATRLGFRNSPGSRRRSSSTVSRRW